MINPLTIFAIINIVNINKSILLVIVCVKIACALK